MHMCPPSAKSIELGLLSFGSGKTKALLVNIDVDGRKTAAGRVSANSAVHVVVGYIVIVGSRMGVSNAHCTVVDSCGFMWLPHLPGHLS